MNNDDNYESKDQRVVRRWRQSWLRSNPPAPATDDEKACVDERMKGFKPKPYVHPHDDIIYEDEDETYPWERPGWDREAALHAGYVPPSAEAELDDRVVETGDSFAAMFDKFSVETDAESGASNDTPPAKADPAWTEPTPAEKAKITALVAARWTVADMAKYLEISQDEFLWAFHDTLRTAELQMRARLTTTMFGDGLSAPGSARNRIANFMGVFKDAPKPPLRAQTVQPRRQSETRARSAGPGVRTGGRNSRRSRYGGPPPKPNPDGIIEIRMILGDDAMNAGFDAAGQKLAHEIELLIDLRASRSQDRDGNPLGAAS